MRKRIRSRVNRGVSAESREQSERARVEVPPSPRIKSLADVAQLVEHSLGKGEVTGSIPVISSRI